MRKIVFGVLLLLCLIVYVVGVVGLVTTPDSNAIPTPGLAVVFGVIAMFSTLGFFIVGFVAAATVPE